MIPPGHAESPLKYYVLFYGVVPKHSRAYAGASGHRDTPDAMKLPHTGMKWKNPCMGLVAQKALLKAFWPIIQEETKGL